MFLRKFAIPETILGRYYKRISQGISGAIYEAILEDIYGRLSRRILEEVIGGISEAILIDSDRFYFRKESLEAVIKKTLKKFRKEFWIYNFQKKKRLPKEVLGMLSRKILHEEFSEKIWQEISDINS